MSLSARFSDGKCFPGAMCRLSITLGELMAVQQSSAQFLVLVALALAAWHWLVASTKGKSTEALPCQRSGITGLSKAGSLR